MSQMYYDLLLVTNMPTALTVANAPYLQHSLSQHRLLHTFVFVANTPVALFVAKKRVAFFVANTPTALCVAKTPAELYEANVTAHSL